MRRLAAYGMVLIVSSAALQRALNVKAAG